MNQPLSEVPNWQKLPMETIVKLVDLKRQATQVRTSDDEYQADSWSEAMWLKQFGGDIEP